MGSIIANFYLTFRGMPSNMHDLDLLFNPSSVAVIGASSDRNKLSGRTIHFLKTYGFKGKIFPVNPRHHI